MRSSHRVILPASKIGIGYSPGINSFLDNVELTRSVHSATTERDVSRRRG